MTNKMRELNRLIEEMVLGNRGLILEKPVKQKTTTKQTTLKLPKFALSEAWGEPTSEDRKIISTFMNKIPGANVAQKITSINKFVSDCDFDCINETDVEMILSNLVVLDSLSSLITDFNPQSGGYLMEAFVTGLLGGEAKQVPVYTRDKKTGKRVTNIVDIYTSTGEPISVKFLSPGSEITGSESLLKAWIEKNGPLKYLLIQKKKEDKEISGFTFYNFTIGDEAQGKPGNLDVSQLPAKQADVISEERKIAILDYGSKGSLEKVANQYVGRLGDRIVSIFEKLDLLTTKVNDYLLAGEKAAASEASSAARSLSYHIEKEL